MQYVHGACLHIKIQQISSPVQILYPDPGTCLIVPAQITRTDTGGAAQVVAGGSLEGLLETRRVAGGAPGGVVEVAAREVVQLQVGARVAVEGAVEGAPCPPLVLCSRQEGFFGDVPYTSPSGLASSGSGCR